jgi:hypothetical protein
LLNLDRLEFTGETEYFSIHASASDGGTITPEGTTYYARGTAATFHLVPDFNYVLDSLLVDGIPQPLSDTYSIEQVSGNHILRAYFSGCLMAPSTPWSRVNEDAEVQRTDLAVTEGSDVTLWVEHDGSLAAVWSGPDGIMATSDTLYLQGIRKAGEGTYTCTLENSQGCVTEHLFHLSVDYIDLAVYEAESFLSQSGIRLGSCTDWGGGKYVGYIGNGDWCQYLINLDAPGYYDLTARVAGGMAGGTMEISTRDTILGIVNVSPGTIGEGEEWVTTVPVEIALDQGPRILQFTFRGEGEELFRFNWFNLQYSRPLEATSSGEIPVLELYPNPLVTGTTIRFSLREPSRVDLEIVSPAGSVVRSLISGEMRSPGTYTVQWDTRDHEKSHLSPGIYLVRFRLNDQVITRKALLISGD